MLRLEESKLVEAASDEFRRSRVELLGTNCRRRRGHSSPRSRLAVRGKSPSQLDEADGRHEHSTRMDGVREAHELIALALALEDEGRPDEDVVAALVAAAEGHTLRLQSAYASTLYLSHELPFDQRAHDLSATFLRALEHVAAHQPADDESPADTASLGRGGDRETPRALADWLATATGDRESVLRNARRLQADLDRLRQGR